MPTDYIDEIVAINSQSLDSDGFIKLWDLVSHAPENATRDEVQTRELAGKLLGFLCKTRYEFILLSQHNANYLQDRFDRDESILFNWSPETDNVDLIAQHIEVPAEAVVKFLREKRFKPTENYNPRRSTRLLWFNEDWKVG